MALAGCRSKRRGARRVDPEARNKAAAKRLMRKLIRASRTLRVIVTDKLGTLEQRRTNMPGVQHQQHKGLNNLAENSHQPTRRASGS